MDKMLVRCLLTVFGFAIGINSLSINADLSLSKNDTSDSLLDFKSIPVAKPKRQLDNFEFDLGSFEGSTFFKADKKDDTTSLDILDSENFSGFLPTVSKATRSNAHDLGIHSANFDSSSSSSENYQSDSEVTKKLPEVNVDYYSNEDQSALSQSQVSTTIDNLGTTLHSSNVSNESQFIPTKPSPFLDDQKNLPTLQYNTYPTLAEYASDNPVYSSSNQLPIQTVSPSHQTHSITYIPYKAQYSHPSKTYAPFHNLQQQQYTAPYLNTYNNIRLTTAPTVEINGKKLALPILQLQTEIPNYVKTLGNSPGIFGSESGLQYKTKPGLGVSFDFAKPKNNNQRLGTNAPFLVTHNSRTTQILPLKTSGSTPQFPQYKGASLSQSPNRGFSVIPNDYQEFKLQPQLHFNKHVNNKNNAYDGLKNYQKYGIYSNPSQIRTDVEIIDKKKKKPLPPLINDDGDEKDDDISDEDYIGRDSYLPRDGDDGDKTPKKYFKNSELDGDFIPSKSYSFKEYDQTFNEPKKASFDSDDDNDGDDGSNVNLATKYRYLSKSNGDDEDDNNGKDANKSLEDKRKSKYRSYKNHYESENDENEEGTDIKHRRNQFKSSERNNDSKKTRHSRKEREYSGEEYEQPYDNKYPSKISTNFDVNYSKSHPNHGGSNNYVNKYRAYRDESGEPSRRPISFSSLQNDANIDSKSTEKSNYSSKIKNSNIKLPQTIWRNSYGKRVSDPDDDSNRSSYSQEEVAENFNASAISKHPISRSPLVTTQEYTTRPAHKTSTIVSKGLVNSYFSKTTELPIQHRSAWKKEDKHKLNSGTHNRKPSIGVKGLVYPTQTIFNLDFD